MPDRPSRPAPFSLRLTTVERLRLDHDAAGMSLGTYVRWRLFDSDEAPPRKRGKVPVKDHQALSAVLGRLGQSRISNNLNQLAKLANSGSLILTPEVEADLREAVADIAAMRTMLVAALGPVGQRVMILKASQRGGGAQLGAHLLKAENEHVEVHEVRGFVADDVKGAMKEAQAVAQGTRCKQYLFSVSLNPPASESVAVAKFESAIDRIEAVNGLTGQPRIVVFHEKEGRRHAHAVWSRVDADTMKAVPLPYFKTRLQEVSKALYLEHGWLMPRGLVDSRQHDPRNFSLAEWQQAKRMGRDPKLVKAAVQDCWAISDSLPSFSKALEERGLYLAKGDRRGHVVLTLEGEIISVARMLGKSAIVRAKLGRVEEARSLEKTRSHIAVTVAPRLQELVKEAKRARRVELMPLHERRHTMKLHHQVERQRLDEGQTARAVIEAKERAGRLRGGVLGVWDRLTGRHGRTFRQNDAEALASIKRDRAQRDELVSGQLRERHGLQRDILAVRHRHAESVLELHRDLAQQTREGELKEENARESFADAARGGRSPPTSSSPSRRSPRGRGRDAGRDGPGLG